MLPVNPILTFKPDMPVEEVFRKLLAYSYLSSYAHVCLINKIEALIHDEVNIYFYSKYDEKRIEHDFLYMTESNRMFFPDGRKANVHDIIDMRAILANMKLVNSRNSNESLLSPDNTLGYETVHQTLEASGLYFSDVFEMDIVIDTNTGSVNVHVDLKEKGYYLFRDIHNKFDFRKYDSYKAFEKNPESFDNIAFFKPRECVYKTLEGFLTCSRGE